MRLRQTQVECIFQVSHTRSQVWSMSPSSDSKWNLPKRGHTNCSSFGVNVSNNVSATLTRWPHSVRGAALPREAPNCRWLYIRVRIIFRKSSKSKARVLFWIQITRKKRYLKVWVRDASICRKQNQCKCYPRDHQDSHENKLFSISISRYRISSNGELIVIEKYQRYVVCTTPKF